MKILAASLLSIALAILANAAEITAWKAPLSNLSYEGLEAPGISRMEKPPEKSPFFGEKDVLWDVHAILPEKAASAEWAVWNETTRRIVVKGPWMIIREMEESIKTASHCRVTVEAFRVAEDGTAPDFTKPPDASISLVTGSGQKATGSNQEDDSAIKLEMEPTVGYENDFIDLRMIVSTTLPGAPDLEINTALSFKAGGNIWVARDFDGKSGTDIRVTATIELPDGTPYAEMMMRQEGNSAAPFRVDRSGRKPIAIEGGGLLVSAWLSFKDVRQFITGEKATETDPFAVSPDVVADLDGLPITQVPKKLEPYFGGEVVDMRETIRKMGIIVGEDDFVGFDPRSQRIFMFSKNNDEIEKFEMVFDSLCCLHPPENMVVTLRETGQTRLVGRSGRKASLKSSRPETKQTRIFEVEPTSDGEGKLVDLRVLYEEKSGEKVIKDINTAITLNVGDSLDIMTSKAPDGTASAMEIKAEILEVP